MGKTKDVNLRKFLTWTCLALLFFAAFATGLVFAVAGSDYTWIPFAIALFFFLLLTVGRLVQHAVRKRREKKR